MEDNNKKYPEGHFVRKWMAIGMAVSAGIGIPLSISTGNPGLIGIWPALGVSFGLAVGTGIEKKYKEKGQIRPLTEEEKKRKKIALTIALISLTILSFTGLVFFLLAN